MNSATIKLLDELRHSFRNDNGLASDDDVAQELGIPKATILAWRVNGVHMDGKAALRACDQWLFVLAGFESYFRIAAQREKSEVRRFASEVVADIETLKRCE